MTRTKRRAKRRVPLSTSDDAEEDAEASNLMERYEVKNDEIESFVEEFEDVDNVVTAVMEINHNFQRPTEQTLAENSESDNMDKSSVDPWGSNREASVEELDPHGNGVCPEQNSTNDKCPAADVKEMELLNRCADDGGTTVDMEGGERQVVRERTGDDGGSNRNSEDGGISLQPSTSIENKESQINQREKFSMQVKTVYIEGPPKSWNADKLRELCEQFGQIKNVKVSRNLNFKGKDFGFIAFTTRYDALACIEGINGMEFEGHLQVKAYIARPLIRGWLPRVNHGRSKTKHKPIAGWKMRDKDRYKGSENENGVEREMQTILPSHGAIENATSFADKSGQSLPNLLGTKNSETKKCKSDNPHAIEDGLPSIRKKKRKRKSRRRGKDITATKKQEGNSQEQASSSSRKPRSKSRSRKRQKHAAKEYVARQKHFPVYSSKILSEMAPHAGYIKINQQSDSAGWIGRAFGHKQHHMVNTEPVHNGSQPYFGYQKTFLGNDALPHAGYIEPVGKQCFGNHAMRRLARRR